MSGIRGISTIELRILLKELSRLYNSRLYTIHQLWERDFLLTFKAEGKSLLRIALPYWIWITNYELEKKEPFPLVAKLRSYLENAVLDSVEQLGADRIVVFKFHKKEDYYLIVELFSRGNLILCDKDKKVMAALEQRIWKDRAVTVGKTYSPPPEKPNVFLIGLEDFLKALERKRGIASELASSLGIGGLFAEETCARSGIEKTKIPNEEELKKLYRTLKELLLSPPEAYVVLDEKGEPVDAIPFKPTLQKAGLKRVESFNQAIDELLTKQLSKIYSSQEQLPSIRELEAIRRSIEAQELAMKEHERKAEEYQRMAKMLYERYDFFQRLRERALELNKKLGLKKAMELLKDEFPNVKAFSEEEWKIVVEV